MNIIYKSKWSESTNTWVACSELVRGKTKNDCSKIVVAITLALASLSTYAACDPIINADTNYPDIQATSGDQCNLDAEQIYNRITAKQGSKISGTNITADGPKKGSAQSISLVGDSELEADNVTTTNTRPGSSSQAFYQNKSKSTIHQDLNANNTGVAANSEILKNVNGSTLEIGRNLTIKDNSTTGSSYNTIYNENSQINVNGDINIDNTGVKDSSTKANTAINNVGGKISANNVVIKQNGTASSISQQSKGDPDTLIDIKGNLDIDSTTSLSSITVNGGKISVGKNTNIIKKAEEKDTAVIGITAGGTFESKGDTTMTINSADTSETDITASGVSIGADSKYINHGNLKVNNGQNTIITSDEDLADGEIATFDNTTTAKTSSAVDTVVHKGRGTLVVNNDGVLESTNNEKGSVLSNQNEGVLEATNSNILSGNIKNNSKGKIVLQNTGKVNEDGNGSVNPNQIINNDTGSIAIINNNTMGGNIINKGGLRSTDNISVENNKNLTSHIKNDGAGSILVNNNASSNLSGDIENTQTGKITLNNNGNVTSKDIKNTDIGTIELNNQSDTSKFNSNITNSSNGTITLINSGIVNEDAESAANPNQILNGSTGSIAIINNNTMGGNIINKGGLRSTDNISVENNKNLTSHINNDGAGSILVNNNASSNLSGDIENTQTGKITLNNKGNVTSKDIKNTDIGTIELNNQSDTSKFNSNITNSSNGTITLNNSGIVNEDAESAANPNQILNGSTGSIAIINNNTMGGNIINKGGLRSTDNISVENNKNLTSHINNDGAGSILVNNNASSNLSGDIENTQTGKITLNNKGNVTSKDIKNTDIGTIELNNQSDTSKFNSNITNSSNGTITLINSGIVNEDAEGAASPNQILNGSTGSIAIINNNTMGGNIINKGGLSSTDNISVENNKNLTSHINNDGAGSILVKNNASGIISGSISNTSTGAIKIFNNNILSGSITNTGAKGLSDTNNINIINNRKITGNITNQGTGSIEVTNNADGELDGDISNESSGIISLINNGNIDNQATGVSSSTGKINNLNNGTLKITNNHIMSRAFDNNGTGTLIVENNGQMNGNKITNNDEGTIEIHNNLNGHLDSEITNTKKGNIQITNDDVLGGLIANLGERKGSDENNIEIINRKTLTSTIRNDASGAIKISNESSGNLSSNIINNRSGKISFINQGVSSPAQITNSGTGEVSVINNHILRTDVTNDATSSGLISFSNTADFDGNLINANSGSIIGVNTGNFTGTTSNSGFAKNGKIDIDNQGIWTNTGNSVLTNLTNSKGTIKFPEIPSVDAADKDKYHSITVKGDYTGGGQMYVNTFWNKDGTTYSDRVDIAGNVIGNKPTTVHTANKNGIYGDVTQKEIPIHSAVVVHVDGQTTGSDFTGKAPTTNAGEAQLEKINTTRADGSAGTDYAWTLKAKGKTGPDKPNPPEVPIYAEPVSGYVQMPTADMELGFTTIGTLHERRSENQTYNINGTNNTALGEDQQQTWARVVVKHLDKDGKKRLDTAGNQSVLQIGHDFILDENDKNGTRRHVGGYVAYGHNENDFRDQYRAENGRVVDDHYNGKGRTDAVSVGGYGTFYGINGGYVDLVGQVTYLRNKYSARSNESEHQNGWGAALSAETGKSFIVYGNNWFIEPQAQLVYQYLSLDDFNDRIRHVDQHDPSALRGRVGMRFGYNGDVTDNLPPSSFYGIANIWHDFVNPKSVDIGRDSLKEEYAKTWGELGLGIQLPITKQSDFYGDVRYEKNFGSDKRKGFKGTMGYKYTWL